MKLPRVYGLVDGAVLEARGMPAVGAAETLLDGGIRILQFRWKQHYTRAAFRDAKIIAEICAQAGAIFIVNDRADVAVLLEAGLHVGQDDLPPADARKLIGASRILGFSTHNEAQVRAAILQPVDYIAIGPVFATSSKPNPDPVLGLAELARLRKLINHPLVAIGGITRERARDVWDAGADAIAVTADLYPTECSPASIRSRAEEWIRMANEYSR